RGEIAFGGPARAILRPDQAPAAAAFADLHALATGEGINHAVIGARTRAHVECYAGHGITAEPARRGRNRLGLRLGLREQATAALSAAIIARNPAIGAGAVDIAPIAAALLDGHQLVALQGVDHHEPGSRAGADVDRSGGARLLTGG